MRHRTTTRRVLCAIALLTSGLLSTSAQRLSREQAMQNAAAFLGNRVTTEKLVKVNLTDEAAKGPGGTDELIYVFNIKGGGFVITSGDAGTAPVLGFSDSGTFDAEHMPVAMKGLIDRFRQQMLRYGQRISPNANRRPYKNYRCEIKPLVETSWGQRAPYNDLCPTVGGQRCVTGCVATAMAQLMYFFKWPLTDTNTIPSYLSSAHNISIGALSPRRFDWNKMLKKYTNATPEQNRAIAELMQYCGSSVHMSYGPEGSSAYMNDISNALNRYFGYKSQALTCYRSGRTNDEWEEMIYDELCNGRPVIYSGDKSDGGGHCFLVDGYDRRGFFHFNWGWGGTDDGYFRLTLEDAASDAPSVSYVDDHWAVIGIQRPMRMWGQMITADQNLTLTGLSCSAASVGVAQGQQVFRPFRVTCLLQNTIGQNCTADIAVGLYRGNQLIDVFPLNAQQIAKGTKTTKQIIVNRIYTDMTEGDYILRVVAKETKKYKWFPVLAADEHALKVHLTAGGLTISKYNP